MSFWSKVIELNSAEENGLSLQKQKGMPRDTSRYAFVDVEVGIKDKRIHDIGALRWDGAVFHSANKHELQEFLRNVNYVCGHNIIHHDAKYLFGDDWHRWMLVDTLYVSPLLFPDRPYHRLLKDDKLMSEQMNNPSTTVKRLMNYCWMRLLAGRHCQMQRKKFMQHCYMMCLSLLVL